MANSKLSDTWKIADDWSVSPDSGKDWLWEMASDVDVEARERKVAKLAIVIEEDAEQREKFSIEKWK